MSDDRLAVVQTFFTRYFEGHVDEALTLLEPTVVYHVPAGLSWRESSWVRPPWPRTSGSSSS